MQKLFLALLISFCLSFSSLLFGQESQKLQNPHPTDELKKQMIEISSTLSEIQSLKSTNPIPWSQIKSKTQSIQNNLLSIKKKEMDANAQAYLGRLISMVAELEILESKKDSKVFDRIPAMTQTCYQCHKSKGVLGITEVKH